MNPSAVNNSISFAYRRLEDLKNLGDLSGADWEERQILIQEFFFHLVGAIEILAQAINKQENLGLDPSEVSVGSVINRLDDRDIQLKSYYANYFQ